MLPDALGRALLCGQDAVRGWGWKMPPLSGFNTSRLFTASPHPIALAYRTASEPAFPKAVFVRPFCSSGFAMQRDGAMLQTTETIDRMREIMGDFERRHG